MGKVRLKPLHLQSSGRPRPRWIRPVANFGPGSGPDGSGPPVRFIWADVQGKPLILDPFRSKFDDFGPDCNFGRHLTSPVLLCSLAAGAFFNENDHPAHAGACLAKGVYPKKSVTVEKGCIHDKT